MGGLKLIILLAITISYSGINGLSINRFNGSESAAEDDDSWRAQALLDIEKYCKTDLYVSVTDSFGRSIPDDKVRFEMKRAVF